MCVCELHNDARNPSNALSLHASYFSTLKTWASHIEGKSFLKFVTAQQTGSELPMISRYCGACSRLWQMNPWMATTRDQGRPQQKTERFLNEADPLRS